MSILKEKFGKMPDGRAVSLYTITNGRGASAAVTDLGAVWVRMTVPDREGKFSDVLLGYDDAAGYLVNGPHLGSVVGRIANRTGNAEFHLHGKTYEMKENSGLHNLHSGDDYYDQRLWEAAADEGKNSVTFSLLSPDGDQGFPGNLKLSVTYHLTEEDAVEISYEAVSDADTPLNVTNHAYFNLNGHDGGSILNHRVRIEADHFTPSDAESITTGEILKVAGTPMDFRTEKSIGREIDSEYQYLIWGHGYDHNWCLNHPRGEYALAASAYSMESGRGLFVYTDLPGLQFYTANWLNHEKGKERAVYESREAFCFETQFYPDAVNKPQFASPVIKAGETFRTKSGYRFFTR